MLVNGVPVAEPLTEDEAVVEDPFALLPPLFSAFFAIRAAFDAEIATMLAYILKVYVVSM